MLKRIIIRILFRLLDSSFEIDYKNINKEAWEKWAYESYDDPGWRSYFAYEDLTLLKSLRQVQENPMYWVNVGRSLQLLYMMNEMKKAVELRKSKQEKELSKNAVSNK